VTASSQQFAALGYAFDVAADDPAFVERIDWVYADLVSTVAAAPARYEILQHGTPEYPYSLLRDGDLVAADLDQGRVLAWLQWDVNRQAASSSTGAVIHAGAVQAPSGAVLLAGGTGAGKSTLVGLLLQQGMNYLTDEVVSFDAEGRVLPFPKPLSLAPASVSLLGLRDRLPGSIPGEDVEKRLVPAGLVGSSGVGVPCPVRLVVLPERRSIRRSTVSEISRAEALHSLMGHLHAVPASVSAALEEVASAIGLARCVRVIASESIQIAALVTHCG
jgi:hypothetical protein